MPLLLLCGTTGIVPRGRGIVSHGDAVSGGLGGEDGEVPRLGIGDLGGVLDVAVVHDHGRRPRLVQSRGVPSVRCRCGVLDAEVCGAQGVPELCLLDGGEVLGFGVGHLRSVKGEE